MNIRKFISGKANLLLFATALLCFLLSLINNIESVDSEKITRSVENKVHKRIQLLDRYMARALTTEDKTVLFTFQIPEDIVIYKYVHDSLQAWCNQFSILNDDISSKVEYQRITTISDRITSPLCKVTEKPQFLNYGPKWFIIKSLEDHDGTKIIGGIEIKNDLIEQSNKTVNGVNPILKLSPRYTIHPLSYSGGDAISFNGTPLFKILFESSHAKMIQTNSILKWTSVILLLLSSMLFLKKHKTNKVYAITTIIITILAGMSYFWGKQLQTTNTFFSPNIYADGPVFFSFGALFLTNTFILCIILTGYMMQKRIIFKIQKQKNRKIWFALYGLTVLTSIILTVIFINWELRSIINNSNISLNLYRWNENTLFSILVYITYISLICTLQMQLNCLKPVFKSLFNITYNQNNKIPSLILLIVTTLYFSLTVINLGFQKEQHRTTVWSNRLAMNRDLELEMILKNIERSIETDSFIANLSTTNSKTLIENRIIEFYLHPVAQKYDIRVSLINDDDINGLSTLNNITNNGESIVDGSKFLFVDNGRGYITYSGIFSYSNNRNDIKWMLINLESRDIRGDRGYYSLLNKYSSSSNDIGGLEAYYSYAKYIDGHLSTYKGKYPYPTRLEEKDLVDLQNSNHSYINKNGYIHFINKTSDNEIMLISRRSGNSITFFTTISYLFLLEWLSLYLFFTRKKNKTMVFKNNYFRSRIYTIILLTSIFILVGITTVSLIFIFQRNEINLQNIMSSKISLLQNHVEPLMKEAEEYTDLDNSEFIAAIEDISRINKSDIALYSPEGKVFLSTTPEVFEKTILSSRINANAYHNIVNLNHRFYIHDEKVEDQYYYSMYAPIFNGRGNMIAILSAPYTEENFNFKVETVMHTSLVLNLFLIMLLASLFFSSHEVNTMFSPLIAMGKKMSNTNINNLEYLEYDRNDEITTIVEEYNRMVKALHDSSRQLAMAERDKAWSEMARQVAHEIKNPLTPIKLKIQNLIRQKKNNNPIWMDRFDEVGHIILEQIDILTDTANEFSDFAKLYTEDPVLIDLDKILKEQVILFDNKENITISYIGMEESLIMAPKPQLIRVFVNLITNAIQAVEIQQNEQRDSGEEVSRGRIVICLRNSTKDGYYDIVFDDNGPGVKDENLDKLFTPKFTTKNSGTGLGLAICRNIIEKCDGEISYKRSFALKGASFTVTLPKYCQIS